MKEVLKIAVKAVDDKKASDIVVMDISGVASFADYFLLCTGDSSRQIHAIADEVEAKLAAKGTALPMSRGTTMRSGSCWTTSTWSSTYSPRKPVRIMISSACGGMPRQSMSSS